MRLDDLGKTIFIILLFVFAVWSATLWPPSETNDIKPVIDGVILEEEYPDVRALSGMKLYVYNDEEYAYIGLSSAGLGWVAVGFLPVDVHKGADFLFGAVVEGETMVSDQYGLEQYRHEPDTFLGGTSDILEFDGSENSGTFIEFKIKMNSGDPYDVLLECGKSYSIILAYSETVDDFQTKHSMRLHHTIKLLCFN